MTPYKMDLRRIAKHADPLQYEELNNEIIKICRIAKKDWMIGHFKITDIEFWMHGEQRWKDVI